MDIIRKNSLYCSTFDVRFYVGDRIQLGDYYTATCQKAGKKHAIFLLDQYCDCELVMNSERKTNVTYQNSDLRCWINNFYETTSIFNTILNILEPFNTTGDMLRLPLAEELFENTPDILRLSNKKQWPLMKKSVYRSAKIVNSDTYGIGWLQNNHFNEHFACASSNGDGILSDICTSKNYVRLVFKVVNKNLNLHIIEHY